MIACVECNELGCENCSGGFVVYTECPSVKLTRKYTELVNDAEMFKLGVLQESGGTHDQDSWYVNASRRFLDYKAELGDFDYE